MNRTGGGYRSEQRLRRLDLKRRSDGRTHWFAQDIDGSSEDRREEKRAAQKVDREEERGAEFSGEEDRRAQGFGREEGRAAKGRRPEKGCAP